MESSFPENRDEHLHRTIRQALFDLSNGLGEMNAEVGQVVAIDRRDHGVLQPHRGDRFGTRDGSSIS
jgi:hypothetical protein